MQAEVVTTGGRRDAALRLVELALQFGQPVHIRDRYCLICTRAFRSTSCPDHRAHHIGHQLAVPASIITVRRAYGWVVVPEGQLPAQFVLNVQVK